MLTIGIRELKAHLSHYLSLVQKGEMVTVTQHGHPIARLTSTSSSRSAEAMQRLVAEGKVIWNGGKPKFGYRVPITGPSILETIQEDREERI